MPPTQLSRRFGQIGVVAFSLSAEGHCSRVWPEHILGEQAGARFSDQAGEESGLVTSTVSPGETLQDRVVVGAERLPAPLTEPGYEQAAAGLGKGLVSRQRQNFIPRT